MTTIAILGLGEAGRVYARGLLAAGAHVCGYDEHRRLGDPDLRQLTTLQEALHGADVVLSLVGGASASAVAAQALPFAGRGAVYADLNTASPQVKGEIATEAARMGVAMADVAVLAPVQRIGIRTGLLASGAGAPALADQLRPLGVPIVVLDAAAGEAARLKLLRSVFMKGLAALMIEGVGAARAIGAEQWLLDQMAGELGPDGRDLVDRLVQGTYQHAVRREQEVRDALGVIEATGRPADMTRATLSWFERINGERDA
ncbi:MAG TPA: DUF1932 domain-containing protein [Microbacterium sp.]|uniref:NAD(P)-dependent oxidoreductase n=1 Tax=Microbacterium sp. TaxID=51671 RepID=UPI002BBA603F|nr:DUF1932 domain-containing protein [Microbacterium sp.]HWI29964.1 DUF1932 domain-containing protein [Microbacterium sp.]